MTIVAFAGTLSRTSINKALIEHAGRLLSNEIAPGTDVDVLDLNDYEFPLYSPEREAADGVPAKAQELFDKIGASDGVIISFAEYNGSYSAAYKNAFDWMSRITQGVFQDKPVLMMAASPGGRAGASVLGGATTTAPFFAADLRGSLGVGSFYDNFDMDAGELTNPELKAQLVDVLNQLIA